MKKIVLILLFLSNALSANECLNLQNALKNIPLWTSPTESYIGYGFEPDYQWDESNEQWDYVIDDIGLKINKIYPESSSYDAGLLGMTDKITDGIETPYLSNESIRITHINEIKINNLSNEEIDQIISTDLIGKKIVFTTLNTETNLSSKKTLSSRKIFSPPEVSILFDIDDFMEVNPKRMEYTVRYFLEYSWIDNRWLDILKKAGLGQKDKTYSCPYSHEEINYLEYQHWEPVIEFTNKVSVIDTAYNKPIRDELHIGLTEDDEVFFQRIISEAAVFNSPLYFKDFPFDQHEIYFELGTNNYDFYFLEPIEDMQNNADLFLEYIVVPEWNMNKIDYSVENYYIDGNPYNSFYYSLTIQRDYNYYIYKLIIPIFIIMMICWSVFWINAKQIETRLTVTVVSFLTLIAYNFVIVDDIPKVGTFTIFDSIILLAYIYAALGTLLSIYSYSKYETQSSEFSNVDHLARYIGPLSYLVILLFIVLILYNKYIALGTYVGLIK